MENAVGQTGIRQQFERSGSPAGLARIPSLGRPAATLSVMVVFLVVVTIAGSFLGGSGGAGHLAPPPAGTPVEIPATPPLRMDIGAGVLGPFGLINPRALQAHAPIDISGNSQWTSANGVRYGAGTTNNPYVIENWSITQSTCNYAAGIQINGNSTVYAIIRNNLVINACTTSSGGGITLGTSVYPPAYNADRGDNILVTRNEVHTNANAIQASYSTNNDTISYNAVYMNATGSHYAVTCQGGTYYCKIIGNYIDARSGQSCSGTSCTAWTQGIEIGDYNQPAWYRKAAYAVAAYNTITNATVAGILEDPCYKAQIYSNLVYQNYPGRRPTYISGSLWLDRGILVEGDLGNAGVSNWSQVHDNVALNYTNGIEAFSLAGWYWNNTVLNNIGYGIYVETNASGTNWGHWTDYNVFWNNHGSANANGLYGIPSGGYTTVLDMTGTPTTTSFPMSFTNQGNRIITNVAYSWMGTALNVSYELAAHGPYEPAMTIYQISTGLSPQNLSGSWRGSNLAVTLNQFTASDILYAIASSTNATFQASGLNAAAYYQVYRAGNLQSTVPTTDQGYLAFDTPAPASGSYEVRLANAVAPLTLSVTAPVDGSFATSSSLMVSWFVNDSGSGLQSVLLSVDGGAAVNVTGLGSYTLTGLADGQHVITVTATNIAGLRRSAAVGVVVDTRPPIVSILTPLNNATVTSATVLLTWTAMDATSGVSRTEISLDDGPAVTATWGNYSLAGLSSGFHRISVTAVDNAGLSATTIVGFTVQANSSSSSGGNGSTPAIAEVAYVPSESTVDLTFTQPMNQTSVEQSLVISPDVSYAVQWVNQSHVRLVISGSLAQGKVYQVTLRPTALTNTGTPLEHPFLFQFLAGGANGAGNNLATDSIPILVLVAALLIVNWATAGLLVVHYRKNATRIRSTLGELSKRYRGSLVIVYKRLAQSVGRPATPRRKVVSKVAVATQLSQRTSREVRTVKAPFSTKKK